ncbi:hypothetical protein BV20DRAFT_529925 [Pilatotrama ljubarskyi]|nr:hypothetical protein BV20DRAFT_529925 [Pilatotrama ljubarskyi]
MSSSGHRSNRQAFASSIALIYGLSSLPSVRANCYIDGFGVRHCSTLSTGVRIAIGIASVAFFIIVCFMLRAMRDRSTRRTNLMYVSTGPASGGAPPPGQAPPGYPGSPPNSYYYPNQQPPQYPPAMYNPYASPEGPPPANLPQYAPPPGPPPAQDGYAPPPGPPPAHGGPPQYYAPPPGPPPTNEPKY